MSRCTGRGRFGNQFIRNIAFNIIAEKHDLYTEYDCREEVEKIGLKLYVGNNKYSGKRNMIHDYLQGHLYYHHYYYHGKDY